MLLLVLNTFPVMTPLRQSTRQVLLLFSRSTRKNRTISQGQAGWEGVTHRERWTWTARVELFKFLPIARHTRTFYEYSRSQCAFRKKNLHQTTSQRQNRFNFNRNLEKMRYSRYTELFPGWTELRYTEFLYICPPKVSLSSPFGQMLSLFVLCNLTENSLNR